MAGEDDLANHPCHASWDVTYQDAGLEDGEPIHMESYTCTKCASVFTYKKRGAPPPPPPES